MERQQQQQQQMIYKFEYENLQNKIIIDKSWIISPQIEHNQTLLTCPICYTIPIDQSIECAKCERIFCQKDYLKEIRLKKNSKSVSKCPLCKCSPWIKKQQIHISYRNVFNSMRLMCKLCPQQSQQSSQILVDKNTKNNTKAMKRQQLIDHLQEQHNINISINNIILYDYVFISPTIQKQEIKLDQIDNFQINLKRYMNKQKFQIKLCANKTPYEINLQLMTATALQARNNQLQLKFSQYKLKAIKSQSLQKNKPFPLWVYKNQKTFHINSRDHLALQTSSYLAQNQHKNKWIFLQKHFQQKIERYYLKYKNNKQQNLTCFEDTACDLRYIVNFQDMTLADLQQQSKALIIRQFFIFK